MLDMNPWYCVKYIISPTSGVCLGTGQKAHHFMYTEQYILRYIGIILMTVHVYCLTMTTCFYYTDIHFTAWTLFPLAGKISKNHVHFMCIVIL